MSRLLLLVSVIALLFVVLQLANRDDEAEDRMEPASQQTSYYLRDAIVTEYGQDGHVRIEVAVRSATEDPQTQAVDMEDVAINYFTLPGQSWRLTAQHGHAQPQMRTVELTGDVVMTGQRQSLPQPAVVRTEKLTLDTDTQKVRTDQPVTLGLGTYAVAAVGMQADLKAETLRLESGVNGRFSP